MKILNKTLALGCLSAMVMMMPAPAFAYVQPINLNINQSYYLNTGSGIARVAVANPKIADVKILGASALNVVAFAPGTTTLNIWTKNGMRQEYQVTVSKEDKGLAKLIEKAIDLPGVKVQLVGDRVLLRGVVKNQYERTLAFKIASLYVGEDEVNATKKVTKKMSDGVDINSNNIETEEDVDTSSKVVNLLEMANPDQINIEAMVIEINSDDAKKLGMTYSSQKTSGDNQKTTVTTDSAGNTTVTGNSGVTSGVTLDEAGRFYGGESFGKQRDKGNHWYNRNWLYTHFSQINAQIHALVEQGKARIISRPNITTMSGKTASILVGGEIPVVHRVNDTDTVDYKPYGIQLDLVKPQVDSDGNITAALQATVSRLDWSNAVMVNGFNMPGLTTRRADTMVNIPTGMTMAIGGLLNSEDGKKVSKVPVLGDIPILGELFKYHNNTKNKSEIMILITPRVVNENTPVKMSKKLEDTFNDSRREVQAMQSVDVNGPIPAKKEAAAKKSSADTKDKPATDEYSLDHIVAPEVLQGQNK